MASGAEGQETASPSLSSQRCACCLFVLNIRGAFAVSCLDVHLGTGRIKKRASRKILKEALFPVWVGPAPPGSAKLVGGPGE